MTSLCLIHDGQFIYCLAINVVTVAVATAVYVCLNIIGNLLTKSIGGRKGAQP